MSVEYNLQVEDMWEGETERNNQSRAQSTLKCSALLLQLLVGQMIANAHTPHYVLRNSVNWTRILLKLHICPWSICISQLISSRIEARAGESHWLLLLLFNKHYTQHKCMTLLNISTSFGTSYGYLGCTPYIYRQKQ